MRYLDQKTEILEDEIKEYFKKRNYFAIPKHICDNANELIIYTQNYLVKNEREKNKLEKIWGEKIVGEIEYPITIGKKMGIIFRVQKSEDFANHLPDLNKIELYLINKNLPNGK